MMPFFALMMIESRLVRMLDGLKETYGEETLTHMSDDDRYAMIKDYGQGYNIYIIEKNQILSDICKNDKSFRIDLDAYLKGFDGETKELLGVDATEGEKFLDINIQIYSYKSVAAVAVIWRYSLMRISPSPCGGSSYTCSIRAIV